MGNKKITSYQTAEYGKFVELVNNTEYPPVSVLRLSPADDTNAFPYNAGVEPLSSIEIYPKYAVLVEPVGLREQLNTITHVLCAIYNK
jgi:hypothetical protein